MIPKFTLAHLLGIDTDFLIRNNYVRANNSYEALIEVIEHPHLIKNKYKIDYEEYVSKYIDKKINSLIDNLLINIEECDFVCKYDSARSYGYNDDNNMDYFVVSKAHNTDKYNLLILKESNDSNGRVIYVPQSNQTFDNKDELIDSLDEKIFNQEFTILVSKRIKSYIWNEPKTLFINPRERIKKLNNLNDWASTLNSIPNVLSDYIYSLGILNKAKSDNTMVNDYFESIQDDIRKGKFINIDSKKLPYEIVMFLNAYNDSLGIVDEKANKLSYGKMVSENDKLKEELQIALEEKEIANSNYKDYKTKFEDLDKENKKLKDSIEEINEVIKKLKGI